MESSSFYLQPQDSFEMNWLIYLAVGCKSLLILREIRSNIEIRIRNDYLKH